MSWRTFPSTLLVLAALLGLISAARPPAAAAATAPAALSFEKTSTGPGPTATATSTPRGIANPPTPTATHTPPVIANPPTPTATHTPPVIVNPPTPTATHTPPVIINPPTPTATNTPPVIAIPSATPTRTPTATPTPSANLVAEAIEVTQGIQDLENSVRLVADKRTYVRLYARSEKGLHLTDAQLTVEKGAQKQTLLPLNPNGKVLLWDTLDVMILLRATEEGAFLFELPSQFRSGTVKLTAEVNTTQKAPPEKQYSDNQLSTTVSFEPVPKPWLMIYDIRYRVGDTKYGWREDPQLDDSDSRLVNWLMRAYPISGVNWIGRTHYAGKTSVNADNELKLKCSTVNLDLNWQRLNEPLSVPNQTRYYGMVTNKGGFMRGCAFNIPSRLASGPVGASSWGWDFDGNYGDWYGGHEIGHMLDRPHAPFCDAKGSAYYPYEGGRISPTLTNEKLIGYDIETRKVYGPWSHDVMTYCDNQWVSDFTYEKLMSFIQGEFAAANAAAAQAAPTERLLIQGVIEPDSGVTLRPAFLLKARGDTPEHVPGSYTIVLRDGAGSVLLNYPFTPLEADHAEGTAEQGNPYGETDISYISELVPAMPGASTIEVRGPGNSLLAALSGGNHAPAVNLISPNGGETLNQPAVTVTWAASDLDGDALAFSLEYTPDDGATWIPLEYALEETSIEIDRSNLVSGSQARFRVWASDGVHAVSDTSDNTFVTPNHTPAVRIVSPAAAAAFARGQSIALVGQGYDADQGSLDETLVWTSSRDGALGTGANIVIANLSAGAHTITLTASDGQGGSATDTRQITVFNSFAEMPAGANRLHVGPSTVLLDAAAGLPTAALLVGSERQDAAIAWQAASDSTWLRLDHASGVTPGLLTLSLAPGSAAPRGGGTAMLTFTSPDAPGHSITIPIQLRTARTPVFLPLIVD